MKQPTDTKTMELPMPGAKRGRGRPPTGMAMTSAERQKAYRERVKNDGGKRPTADTHETRFELDYTRPTLEEYDALQGKLNDALEKIKGLEKEQALLIEERTKAFKIAKAAKTELDETLSQNEDKALIVAAKKKISELEAQVDRMMEHSDWSHKQLAAYEKKIKSMEATNKRNASRKKTTTVEPN